MTTIFEVSRRINLSENEDYALKRLSQIDEQIQSVSPQLNKYTIEVEFIKKLFNFYFNIFFVKIQSFKFNKYNLSFFFVN